MRKEDKDGWSFEKILGERLLPVLHNYLTTHPLHQLVWLTQPSSLDKHVSLPEEVVQFPEIHSDSIRHYNEVARQIFK